ncbi:MAG: spermidine synthase [Cyanothece sp. SIO2G6]|nr:spermidine synthase [Cyanothece sp. SIO2G6]
MQAQIFEHSTWIKETNPKIVKHQMQNLLNQSKFSIVGFMEHHFELQGYTAVWLLGESHLAIHTFPEQSKTYLQISSCNSDKHNIFCASLSEYRSNG